MVADKKQVKTNDQNVRLNRNILFHLYFFFLQFVEVIQQRFILCSFCFYYSSEFALTACARTRGLFLCDSFNFVLFSETIHTDKTKTVQKQTKKNDKIRRSHRNNTFENALGVWCTRSDGMSVVLFDV